MGKRQAAPSSSSESEDEESNIKQDNPKKQINQLLLQTANLTSKNQLLQKALKKTDIDHSLNKKTSILNRSNTKQNNNKKVKAHNSNFNQDSFQEESVDSEYGKPIKRTINVGKINKKKEEVSSSDVSSAEDTKNQGEIKSKPEKTTISSNKFKVPNKQLKGESSEDSESDSLPSDEEGKLSKNTSKRVVEKIDKNVSFNSESEDGSESDDDMKRRMQIKKEMIDLRRIKKEPETNSNSESDVENESSVVQALKQKPSKRSLSNSEDEETDRINHAVDSTNKNVQDRMMENLQKSIRSDTSDSDSGASTQSKVKVLQDIRLTSKLKDPKERLQVKYPDIKKMKINMETNFAESEDVYLFRIPKNVDPHLLLNERIDLVNESKVDIGEQYVIKPSTKIPDPALLISDSGNIVQFKNNIKMEKYIKSKKEPSIEVPEKTSVPFPDKLKNRHPLFGADFEEKITLTKKVEQKLDDAIAILLRPEEKIKKKEKKRKLQQEDEKQKEEIFDLLNAHSSVKNRKKETSEDSAFSSSGSMENVSKKDKKKDKQSIIDEILKNVKTESDSVNSDIFLSKAPKKHKKDKKEKSMESGEKKVASDSFLNKSPKKKKYKMEKSMEKEEEEVPSDFLVDKLAKKEKHKMEKIMENEEVEDFLVDESPKKKKKKKVDKIMENEGEEVLSHSLVNKSPKKKKKKKTDKVMEIEGEKMSPSSINQETEVENVSSSALLKNEIKRLSMINSTLKSPTLKAPLFIPDVSGIEPDNLGKKAKKSKKRKKPDSDGPMVEERMISDILDSLKDDILSPSKEKKKKKHKDLN